MVTLNYKAAVIDKNCTGCKKCVWVCPTEAIHMEKNIAVINDDLCMSCPNCHGICPDDAITRVPRAQPKELQVPIDDVPIEDVHALCRKANLHPKQWHCLCTATRVHEAAAAVLKGAITPEKIALETGTRSGCTVYCAMMSMRLLEAAGHEVKQPEKWRLYPTTQTLWDVPQEVIDKYAGYFLEEDKDVFRKF
ncbi:MAG: 4Fe-4S binding protein [Pseudomonadota bacterium]|nr:4Fe-4S binding protein [Pseudomonadota bacterium]